MKSNIFIFSIFTISSLALIGCDQIVDRSMGKITETKNNESKFTNKGNSLISIDNSPKENIIEKPEHEKNLPGEDFSKDNSKELKKKYEVIGTNKDGPYRSGETKRIRSTK